MAENLYCEGMKVTSKEYRENYDRIFRKPENKKSHAIAKNKTGKMIYKGQAYAWDYPGE